MVVMGYAISNDATSRKTHLPNDLTFRNNNNFPLFQLRQAAQPHNRLSCRTETMQVRHGPCVTTKSHSFTCHPNTDHTLSYMSVLPSREATALWLVLIAPTQEGWPSWVDPMCGWLHTEINVLHRGLNPYTAPRPALGLAYIGWLRWSRPTRGARPPPIVLQLWHVKFCLFIHSRCRFFKSANASDDIYRLADSERDD